MSLGAYPILSSMVIEEIKDHQADEVSTLIRQDLLEIILVLWVPFLRSGFGKNDVAASTVNWKSTDHQRIFVHIWTNHNSYAINTQNN
jgi:hypothetical protein